MSIPDQRDTIAYMQYLERSLPRDYYSFCLNRPFREGSERLRAIARPYFNFPTILSRLVNSRNFSEGFTALHIACSNEDFEKVQFLIEECNMENVNILDNNGKPPLYYLFKMYVSGEEHQVRVSKILRYLLENTDIDIACCVKEMIANPTYLPLLQTLVESYGFNLKDHENEGLEYMVKAVRYSGSVELIQYLNHHIFFFPKDSSKLSYDDKIMVLWYSLHNNQSIDVLQYVLSHMDIDWFEPCIEDNVLEYPIMEAVSNKQLPILKWVFENCLVTPEEKLRMMHCRNGRGETMFHRALIGGYDAIKYFLHEIIPADQWSYFINLPNNRGQTILTILAHHLAQDYYMHYNDKVDYAIDLVTKYHADPCIPDNQGNTALKYICSRNVSNSSKWKDLQYFVKTAARKKDEEEANASKCARLEEKIDA